MDSSTSLGYIIPVTTEPTKFDIYKYIFLIFFLIISINLFNTPSSYVKTISLDTNIQSIPIFTVSNGIIYTITNDSLISCFNASTGSLIKSIPHNVRGARYINCSYYGNPTPSQLLVDSNQLIYVTHDTYNNGEYYLDILNESTVVFSEALWVVGSSDIIHLDCRNS